ncbi:hypothetical protein BGZ68_007806 [Mortierella alpina]|nr:hypothetical protein BGZ68_007806 [Mortierella alpina]
MAIGARPYYLVLTVFVFAQLVTLLWPRHYLHATHTPSLARSWLARRSLDPTPDIQCEDVWSHPDRCGFVKQYCEDYPAGLINYLHFYFCDLSSIPAVAIILLSVWLMFLFGFVGVAASDFFCPNLSTIAKQLHLSESMASYCVTFLAFGNGSPDVFSTFSAMGAGSGSLAIGELVGAASFITSVVVGSMAIIKPFKVSRAPFLRDVIFFAGCVLFTLYTVMDGKITFLESLILILYYVFYVAFVVFGNWWHQRAKSERQLEERARNLYDSDDEEDGPLLLDEEQALLSHTTGRTSNKPPKIITVVETGPYDAYEDEEHDDGYISAGHLSGIEQYASSQTLVNSYESTDVNLVRPPLSLVRPPLSPDSGGVEDSISLRPSGTSAPKRRPSLLSAFEATHSYHTAHTTNMDHQDQPESPLSFASSHDGPSVSRVIEGDHPSETASPMPAEARRGHFDAHLEQALLRQSLILPDHHDPNNRHLGHVHYQTSVVTSPDLPPPTSWEKFMEMLKAIMPVYFPTLLDWDEKSHFVKFLAVTSIPMVLLLTLTLPVVELRDEEEDSVVDHAERDSGQLPIITVGGEEDTINKYEGWCRTATTTQLLLAPIFFAAVVTSAAQQGYLAIIGAVILGMVLSLLVRQFSTEERPPRFYGALCFVGFLVAITWIFLVANEVVGILQAFGMIFGVSDAILGLTIFAMGNSLGDLVANITIAKMGFPRMAFSACFGGPLLNMLLGVGISGTYMTAKTGSPIPLEISPTLFVSMIGVLLTLLAAIIVVPRNGYMMGRSWGWFLLSVYLVCTTVNVLIEIMTSKSDH